MASPTCERFRDDLSAFADRTLAPRRWDQVAYHLAGCPDCRAELAAINAVCSELKRCRAADPSDTLAARLESIAGGMPEAPLYMASGVGDLPSARRTRSRIAAQGSVAALVVMMSAVVIAVLIAPEPVRLTNAVKAAREQFSMASSAISVSDALGAVLLASERGADLGESVSYEPRASDGAMVPATATRAASLLLGATESEADFTGMQRVWISDGEGRYRTAEVRTTKVAGEGAKLEVFDARGGRFLASFLPAFGSRPVEAPEGWTFSESVEPEVVGERTAHHLTAWQDGRRVAGWWFDTDTGVLLWAERYLQAGEVSMAIGFKQLTFGEAALDQSDAQLIALQPAGWDDGDGWCVGLSECPSELAGLPLVAHSSSTTAGRRSMTLVYSDGFESAVVGWSEGVLDDEESGTLNQGVGTPTVAMWQCGDAAIWVSTNGSPELVSELKAGLPEELPYDESVLDKVAAGIDRLVPGN